MLYFVGFEAVEWGGYELDSLGYARTCCSRLRIELV